MNLLDDKGSLDHTIDVLKREYERDHPRRGWLVKALRWMVGVPPVIALAAVSSGLIE